MYDRQHLIGAFRRGSRLDSFLDSNRKDQNRKFNQGHVVSINHVERPLSSIERDVRTQERLRRLSMSIKSRSKDLEGDREPPQGKIQIEQILLYINTAAKYNNNIYERKEEYTRMVLDIFSLGGHCSDVMTSSFNNIVSNHRVNVNMTRMDRLLNFLSLVQDLHKNYCDPTIIGIAPRRRFQRETVAKNQDFRSKSLPCINSIYSKGLNESTKITKIDEKPKDSSSQKTAGNIYLKKSILDKYKFVRENNYFSCSENSSRANDIITHRYLGELRKTPPPNIQLPTRKLNRPNSDESSVRKIFESLQRSRKRLGGDKCMEVSPPKLIGQKGYVLENKDSRSKSKRFMEFEETNLKLETPEDQRIQGLRRLIDQLKEVKLGSHVRGAKMIVPRSSSASLPNVTKVSIETNEPCSGSTFDALRPEDLIKTHMEFLNVLNKNIGHEKYVPEKVSTESNLKENTCKEKKRWELDTPYIDYRKIGLDAHLGRDNMKEYCKELISTDYGNNRREQKFIPGVPPVNYSYFETKEPLCVTQKNIQKPDSEAASLTCRESIENHTHLKHPPFSPETLHRDNQSDNSAVHKSVSLSLEQTLEPKIIIPEESLSTKNVQAEIEIPTYIHSPKNTHINEPLVAFDKEEICDIPTFNSAEPVNEDPIDSEMTPIHKVTTSTASSGEAEQNPEQGYDLENSPLEPIKILKNGEVVEEINEIANKLEDITILNESLIKRIEDLPIENVNVSNDNDLSILNSYIENSEKNSPVKEKAVVTMDRISNIEYFTSGDEELRSKIEEYNYWFESANSGNYYELGLDGLNLDEFYYKSMESIHKCYDELIDMSVSSVNNICEIICDKLPGVIMEHIAKDAGCSDTNLGIEALAHNELCEEDLLSFVHNQVMKDPNYLGYKSSVRRDLYPPDDNFILLIIDLIKELVQKWKNDAFSSWKVPITNDLISKQVVDILCHSYEPYLSEVGSEEWILKKAFHAPHYPNILESEKELLNIEHFFKYHSCEDSITNEYINMERQQWLQTSNYYLPLLNEVVEQILHEIIENAILELKIHS